MSPKSRVAKTVKFSRFGTAYLGRSGTPTRVEPFTKDGIQAAITAQFPKALSLILDEQPGIASIEVGISPRYLEPQVVDWLNNEWGGRVVGVRFTGRGITADHESPWLPLREHVPAEPEAPPVRNDRFDYTDGEFVDRLRKRRA